MGDRPERVRVSVRMGSTTHKIIAAAAEREGSTLNDYMLEAALMRVAWEAGVRSAGGEAALIELAEAVRALHDELRAERDAP